jgi:2-C-methyl-D-erythritol 4-phosphate cytidylyltransferase
VGAVWSVVVAGGSGERFGRPKQFALLAGRPVVQWAVEAARTVSEGVVLVLPEAALADRFGADEVVAGGASRSSSVRNGLAVVPARADVVVVHDAARPLAAAVLFDRVLAALEDDAVAGAVCALPVADTLKRVTGEPPTVEGTIDRRELVAVQTPQAFRGDVLRQAHAGGAEATDDAALVEALGATVRVVAGEPGNIKLTTLADLAFAEYLVGR